MAFKIFLSHSHRDGQLARQIKDQVETLGDVSIFLFQDHMEPGQDSYDKIQRAIDASDALVALLTPNSTPSPNVQQEIGYSLGQRKVTVPLVVPSASKDALAMLKPLDYIALDPENSLPGMTQLMKFIVMQRNALALAPISASRPPANVVRPTRSSGVLMPLGGDDLLAALLLLAAVVLLMYAMEKST